MVDHSKADKTRYVSDDLDFQGASLRVSSITSCAELIQLLIVERIKRPVPWGKKCSELKESAIDDVKVRAINL